MNRILFSLALSFFSILPCLALTLPKRLLHQDVANYKGNNFVVSGDKDILLTIKHGLVVVTKKSACIVIYEHHKLLVYVFDGSAVVYKFESHGKMRALDPIFE